VDEIFPKAKGLIYAPQLMRAERKCENSADNCSMENGRSLCGEQVTLASPRWRTLLPKA
jgi:hypothetical protein